MKDALLNRKDLNVILVDWSKGAGFPYGQASGNTRLVGAQIAELIRFLITSTKSPSSFAHRFYILGTALEVTQQDMPGAICGLAECVWAG